MDDITDSMDKSLSKLQEFVKDREIWHAFHGVAESDMTKQLNNKNSMKRKQNLINSIDQLSFININGMEEQKDMTVKDELPR